MQAVLDMQTPVKVSHHAVPRSIERGQGQAELERQTPVQVSQPVVCTVGQGQV